MSAKVVQESGRNFNHSDGGFGLSLNVFRKTDRERKGRNTQKPAEEERERKRDAEQKKEARVESKGRAERTGRRAAEEVRGREGVTDGRADWQTDGKEVGRHTDKEGTNGSKHRCNATGAPQAWAQATTLFLRAP